MTQFPNTAKLLAVLALVLLLASNAPAFSRPVHEWQMRKVFLEVQGQAFHDAVSGAGVFRVAEPGEPAQERRETEAQR